MSFAGINYLGVLLAAIASFLFGGVWYSAFSQRSLADAGEPKKRHARVAAKRRHAALHCRFRRSAPYGVCPGRSDRASWSRPSDGAQWNHLGAVRLGRVRDDCAGDQSYGASRLSRTATLVDGAHWLGVLLIQGAVIGWIGV